MSMRFLSASCYATLLTLAGLTTATAGVHPPDLPLDPRPDCRLFLEGPINCTDQPTPATNPAKEVRCDHLSKSVLRVFKHVVEAVTGGTADVEIELNVGEEQSVKPATTGGCLTHQCEDWCDWYRLPCAKAPDLTNGSEEEQSTDPFEELKAEEKHLTPECGTCPRRAEEARRLFQTGERCRTEGDYRMAHNCYQEVERLCPNTELAKVAQARLQELRSLDDFIEDAISDDTSSATEEQEASAEAARAISAALEALAQHLKSEYPPCHTRQAQQGGGTCCPFAHVISQRELIREMDLQKMKDARSLYFIGERCRRNGDANMASRFYAESIEVCPGSPYAQKSSARVAKLSKRRSVEEGTEEAEVPMMPRLEKELWPGTQWFLPSALPSFKMSPAGPGTAPMSDNRQSQAEKMFAIAESCRSAGDLEKAYVTYQEAHLLCPEGAHGRLAIERMAQIEQQRASETPAEESEPPQDEDVEYRPIVIKVTEQPTSSLMFGVNANAGVVGSFVQNENQVPTESIKFSADLGTKGWVWSWAVQPAPAQCIMFGADVNSNAGCVGKPLFVGVNSASQELPPQHIDLGMIEALDRVLKEITETPPLITVTTEESSTPADEEEEEQELPSVDRSAPVLVPADTRNLRLVDEDDCCDDGRSACLDLSDWLRQVVSVRPNGVHLKIDAARLGRLISGGDQALRDLGCELIVPDNGDPSRGDRAYVVYPATGGKQ